MTTLQSTALIAAALASVAGCYTISVRASSERLAITAAKQHMARDTAEIRLLRAELRTRSRLPELQRWNEQVLALAPPRAEQMMANPVLLASYAADAPAPAAVTAVVRDAPLSAPVVRRVNYAVMAPQLATDAVNAGTLQVSFRQVVQR